MAKTGIFFLMSGFGVSSINRDYSPPVLACQAGCGAMDKQSLAPLRVVEAMQFKFSAKLANFLRTAILLIGINRLILFP